MLKIVPHILAHVPAFHATLEVDHHVPWKIVVSVRGKEENMHTLRQWNTVNRPRARENRLSVRGREENRHTLRQWNTVNGPSARENRCVCTWEGKNRHTLRHVEHCEWTTCQGKSLCLCVGGKRMGM